MKVLFANPPWLEPKEDGTIRWGVRSGSRWPFTQVIRSQPDNPVFGDYTPYPQFLAFACSYAAKHTDFTVRFRDSIALKDSYPTFIKYLSDEKPDFLVMESWTSCWEHDCELIAGINRWFPNTKIILCGPICVAKADEILKSTPVIATVKGEYEKGVVRVLKGERGNIPFDLLTTEEMNAAPPPYMDHIHAYRYADACPLGVKFPHAQVWSSRGCVFKCEFCVTPATMTNNDPDGQGTRKMRFYTPEYMEAWLTDWKERFDYQSIYFDDDTFNMGNKHVERMCGVMRKVGLPWSAMCRADTINRETWKLMRDSGCYGVKIGFESGSQYVVDKIVRKGLDLAKAKETVFYLRSLGMHVHGTFTYGHPGETKEQMQMTRDYRASLPLTSFQESGVAEFEGTPLAALREKGSVKGYEGAKIDENYDRNTDGMKKVESIISSLSNE